MTLYKKTITKKNQKLEQKIFKEKPNFYFNQVQFQLN
jgi:hypothetical protein